MVMEPQLNEDEFRILNYLDIFKTATGVNPIGISTGLKADKLMSVIGKLVEKGYAVRDSSQGQATWKITALGESTIVSHRRSLVAQSGQEEMFNRECEEFDNLNVRFKDLVTRWQVKVVFGTQTVNDHRDPDYDFTVLDHIFSLHEKVKRTLAEMDGALPACNFQNYALRLDQAVEKIKQGDADYLVRNGASYHNVWFEMHESILKLWGRERIE